MKFSLIKCAINFFGVTENQLKWFQSYLNNRVQQCLVNGQLSSPKTITCVGEHMDAKKNKLQIHPSNSKYMIIGSSYNLKNKKVFDIQFLLIMYQYLGLVNTHAYGATMDKRLSWEKHIHLVQSVPRLVGPLVR